MNLDGLNEPQRQAALHGDGPLLVLAGAGTGKTTVITHRIANLIHERGVPAQKILAVTFTNKAAREMRTRAGRYAGEDPRTLDIGTFHGMCGRLLRRHGHRLGLDQQFVIYDESDQLQLIKRCMAELNLDAQTLSPRAIRHRIEQWKNQGRTPDEVPDSNFDFVARKARDLYRLYEKRCLQANAVDFGDMLLHTVTLLRREPEVLEQCHQRWSHILVDEYQDTNPVQYKMLRLLVTDNHSLTVVGDDDQSIYRWRGADIGNILRFERDFPGAEVIRLEENYRSTQIILSAANEVVANNVSRKGKTLFTQREGGQKIRLRLYTTEREEGEAIAEAIKTAVDEGTSPQESAVLYRTNAQSRPIEDALRRHKIPYAIFGGTRFYDRREIRDALAYLKIVSNPRSTIDFLRVVNSPARGIGQKTIDRLTALAIKEGLTLFEVAERAKPGQGGITKRAGNKLGEFVRLIRVAISQVAIEHPARLLEAILEDAQYLSMLRQEGTEEAQDRLDNLSELVAAIDEYVELTDHPSLAGFLEEVSLATDIDKLSEEAGQVMLMTLHSAKGLEFPFVFMPGMEDGLLPHSRSLDDRAGLEEERRLCYVGMTRAKDALILSAARVRSIFGDMRSTTLSRFLAEIPEQLLDLGEQAGATGHSSTAGGKNEVDAWVDDDFRDDEPTESEPTYSLNSSEPVEDANAGFTRGSRVQHATFGEGLVIRSEGRGRKQKLTIEFPNVGRKVIVARFVEPA